MVRIRFMEIKGLYSYGNEKNKIDCGEKTLIVGPNNSGKSSIFKALDFFLRSLTEYTDRESKLWHRQDVHEMTVGFTLNDPERRYTAEVLAICNAKDTQSFTMARMEVVEWLACRLKDITLTIRWIENPFNRMSYRPEYFLQLDKLGMTINAKEYNADAWAAKDSTVPFQYGADTRNFGSVIEESIFQDSLKEEFISMLGQHGLAISKVPNIGHLSGERLAYNERNRIQSLRDMSGNNIPDYNDHCPFFVALGYMLRPKFVFVSEQRRFPESNDLEKIPLKEDGSNMHSFLFWLKNGNRDRQKAYATIQSKFKKIQGWSDASFSVSVTEKQTRMEQQDLSPPRGHTYPDGAIISFPDMSGQERGFVDFARVGAGIKETLFLLSSCFDRQDKVILMDEPAANLHPTLIKRLMHEILTPDAQNNKSCQIMVITHSPAMASLEMLSSVNKIARVDRHDYSKIVQPSKDDEEWISEHLATFHLLKSDILFSRKVVLVEGASDEIFVEAILNLCAEHEGGNTDHIVVNVGGKCSFKKFQKFLKIFKIDFVILADGDAEKKFEVQDAETLTISSLSQGDKLENKTVYILEKDLEHLLACLDPKLYDECKQNYERKPELAYHFIKHLIADNPTAIQTAIKIAHLIGDTNDIDTLAAENSSLTVPRT